MHVADCNGVTNIIAASIIRFLVQHCTALGRTQEARLGQINQRLKDFYALHPGSSRLPVLKLSNLVDAQGWSVLCGQVVKAANTRGLAPFLVELAEEFHSGEERYDVLVRRVAAVLNRFYQILYGADFFLTNEESRLLRQALVQLGSSVQELRELSRHLALFYWHISPKMHMVQHMASYPGQANPRRIQCYQEESHIGSIAKIWARSANGRYRNTVQRMVLLKRLVATVVLLETNGRV